MTHPPTTWLYKRDGARCPVPGAQCPAGGDSLLWFLPAGHWAPGTGHLERDPMPKVDHDLQSQAGLWRSYSAMWQDLEASSHLLNRALAMTGARSKSLHHYQASLETTERILRRMLDQTAALNHLVSFALQNAVNDTDIQDE